MAYERGDSKVVYRAKPHPARGRDIEVYDPLEFLVRVLLHIPARWEVRIRYYGAASSTARRGAATQPTASPSDTTASTFATPRRRTWAKLIGRVFGSDPLRCKHCGGRMRIISFISDPEVIEKILRHLGRWHQGPRGPPARATGEYGSMAGADREGAFAGRICFGAGRSVGRNVSVATDAFPGGVHGHFASQKVPPGQGMRFQIALFGSKGVICIHIAQDPPVYYLSDPLWSPGKTGAAWAPLPGAPSNADPSGLTGIEAANKRLVEDLLRAAETGTESVAGAVEGRATLEMIMAVYAAHLGGGRARFPLADRRHPLGTL